MFSSFCSPPSLPPLQKKVQWSLALAVCLLICHSTDAFNTNLNQHYFFSHREENIGSGLIRFRRGFVSFFAVHRKRAILNLSKQVQDEEEGSESFVSVDAIRNMSVKQLKKELQSMNQPTQDIFEKEQLVQRLYAAKKQELEQQDSEEATVTQNNNDDDNNKAVVRTPLLLTTLNSGQQVAAVNIHGGGGITVNTDQPYATIQINAFLNGNNHVTLNLLLDTACSGFVLRPSVVKKYNLPSYSTPVTMTGAGGTTGATGLTQINKFSLPSVTMADDVASTGSIGTDSSIREDVTTFGPLPAAVQDIGALPPSLDGIIGLSFLSQFSEVELDFCNGVVSLFSKEVQRNREDDVVDDGLQVVAEGSISMVRSLGIPVVNVYLGSRGPVKMLLDSGAASTFLNWKGVTDLGLSKDSRFVTKLTDSMGAIGSDNVSMELTHRIHISSSMNLLGSSLPSYPGLSLQDSKRLSVDIGNLVILDSLSSEGVGGILGIDALFRCAAVRMKLRGGNEDMKVQLLSRE